MQILRNEVFSVEDHAFLADGRYRILDLDSDAGLLILFRLGMLPDSRKPFATDFDTFTQWTLEPAITFVDFTPPLGMTLPEDSISEEQRKTRDTRFELIAPLVDDPCFLTSYSTHRRSSLIVSHAGRLGADIKTIYRLLNRFCEFGQMPNALLDSYENCGAPGKVRRVGSKQLGAPLEQGTFILRSRQGVNSAPHHKNFEQALREVITETKSRRIRFTFERVYRKLKRMPPYCEEIERAKEDNRAPQIPSMRQLNTWINNNGGRLDIDKTILPTHVWQKDMRGLESSAGVDAPVPGSRYEIDSTVADVYIVADYNRHVVLGRPTIYVIVDVASRMIVGLHISLHWASWACARQAIYNAFNEKTEFCRRYGIEIASDDWPSVGVPARILCDRGEMISDKARVVVRNFGSQIQVAPPYRADVKGIVERRFGIANEELHFVPGTTLGQLRERGEPDYRLNSVLTLNEVTEILCSLFIVHNSECQFDDLVTEDLVASDLAPTPVNFWNFHVGRNRHALTNRSKDEVIAALLPTVPASITDRGIKHCDMRFTCDRASSEGWFSKARNMGRSKIEARADLGWTSDLYVRVKGEPSFVRCHMVEARRQFRDRHPDDLTYLREWKREKRELARIDHAKIMHDERVDGIVDNAIKEKRATETNLSKSARTKNISDNRRKALASDTADEPGTREFDTIPKTRAVERSLRLIRGGLDHDDSST